MLSHSLILTLPFFALSSAQAYGKKPSTTTTSTDTSTPTATGSTAAIHSVKVGAAGLSFTPNTLTAKIGDQVEFHFLSSGHSVAAGSFKKPCQPMSDSAFYSGFVNPGGEPFTITVNSTDPLWFYCTAVGHCQGGMVGVINAPSGETESDYASAAGKTSKSGSPPQVQGGVFGVAKVGSGGSSGSGSGGSGSGGSSGGSSPNTTSSAAGSTPTTGGASQSFVMGAVGLVGLVVPVAYVAFAGF